jgi:hypothetical protein
MKDVAYVTEKFAQIFFGKPEENGLLKKNQAYMEYKIGS